MESKNLGHSLKNIPIPLKASYLKSMMNKVEKNPLESKFFRQLYDTRQRQLHKLWFEKQYISPSELCF